MSGAGTASQTSVDWHAWHAGYADPDSELGRRLTVVQRQLRDALDRVPPGPIRAISVCAGQGHDIIGVLAEHPRRADVSARLVELDPQNVALAQSAARAIGLERVEAVAADASLTDAYIGAAPADVVLVCGVFGNIAAEDVANTIAQLGQLCAPQATVIWTRHRRAPDLVPQIRAAFGRAGFAELGFEDAPPFGIGSNRLQRSPEPLRPGVKLFEFIGYGALWPHLSAGERAALGALFRADSSLVELVEAMRAMPYGLPSEPTVESMLLQARGTSACKHLFLAQVLAQRFPDTEPVIVHRVYRLDRAWARERFGAAIADTIPDDGLTDVYRYLTVLLEGRRIALDVTLHGEPWDGLSPLVPACGPGRDYPGDANADAEMCALEGEHCDATARGPFLTALGTLGSPAVDLG